MVLGWIFLWKWQAHLTIRGQSQTTLTQFCPYYKPPTYSLLTFVRKFLYCFNGKYPVAFLVPPTGLLFLVHMVYERMIEIMHWVSKEKRNMGMLCAKKCMSEGISMCQIPTVVISLLTIWLMRIFLWFKRIGCTHYSNIHLWIEILPNFNWDFLAIHLLRM